mmetsp:Transcript_72746/g.194134  ORF Transcript_72746/g.194134 Transcript_72746/m.194134 type:complete len:415 (+) Transcript_72746:33-1277(+)
MHRGRTLERPWEQRPPSRSRSCRGHPKFARCSSRSTRPSTQQSRESCSREVQRHRRRANEQPVALFLMGLPGSGKTTVKRKFMLHQNLKLESVDPDEIKRRHRDWAPKMRPRVDEKVHRWSVRQCVSDFEDLCRKRVPLNLDTSGANPEWLEDRMALAEKFGYRLVVLYVDVPLHIAIFRNRQRAADGGNYVPEDVIVSKVRDIPEVFDNLTTRVHEAHWVQNWEAGSDEDKKAHMDAFFYPPLFEELPPRPGAKGYGDPFPGARVPTTRPMVQSRRALQLGPWVRSERTKQIRYRHEDKLDERYPTDDDRAQYIRETVLGSELNKIEPNMFPYECPPGVEHWTLWSDTRKTHREVCDWVERWIDAERPDVVTWNYDTNEASQTFFVPHVHVFVATDAGWEAAQRAAGLLRDLR